MRRVVLINVSDIGVPLCIRWAAMLSWVCDNDVVTMEPELELGLLMDRYRGGNAYAAAELVNRLSPQLHRFFLMYHMSREHADDLLQETWLRVHEARGTYRSGKPLLPWLYAIARNVRVDHYRKARRAQGREEFVEDPSAIPEPVAEREPDGPGIDAMLAGLPESQREVVLMLKVTGMSLDEVARATSSTVGSVKQKAHRAYERLRKVLGARPESRKVAANER